MDKNEIVLKKSIYKKNNENRGYDDTGIVITCKIILFDNNMIMAEETQTKRLFPIILEDEEGRIIVKNNDRIVEGKYFVKLINSNNHIVFNSIINNFSLLDYVEDNEQRYYTYKGKYIYFFDYIELMSDSNRYSYGSNDFLKHNVGYRYINCDDIKIGNRSKSKYTSYEDIKELEKYGYDLSKERQDSFIGRNLYTKEIIKTIGIKKKSLILVGESGCGKTAIVNDIALNHMDRFLEGRKIYSINSSSLIAGTKYRGDFEDRFNNIIRICERSNGNIILFIDEIHTLCGLGTSDDNKSNDALSILKPYIDNGKVILIGATTTKEYNKYIKNDIAFARRLEKIDIPNFTNDELLIILLSYIRDLENKYNIDLDLEDSERVFLLEELLKITDKNRQRAIDTIKISNPSISKDILENAFVEAKYNESEFVTLEDIYYAINNHSNLSSTLCNEMENKLKNVINSPSVKKRVRNNIIDFKEVKYSKI